MTNQTIHGSVKSSSMPVEFFFTATYGLHTVEDRRSLWTHLRDLRNGMQRRWLIMGDFNIVLNPEDRITGNPVLESETTYFNDFIVDSGMCELRTIGRDFTWTNSHIFGRIDRALVNTEWMTSLPQVDVEIMVTKFSDYSPLCINVTETLSSRPRPFKFLNHLAEHRYSLTNVERGWRQTVAATYMKRVWLKLKKVKEEMKALNSEEFSKVKGRILDARTKLAELQEHMRDHTHDVSLFETERNLKKEIEKWSMVEESIYRQKFRIQWLQIGESNTTFFFANMKNRTAHNHINKLQTSTGNWIQTEAEIT
uniref:Endonuclease/exonuclease/phosphatase domain-containing protein n=2 Tax=Nicotiana tabacum TaxID=4097 RepID=A0A1S3X962_TOBAC|nr:PREDICTED: uncharacterized protein LOC107762590 [Nicotiana tabacum]